MKFSDIDLSLGSLPIPFQCVDLQKSEVRFLDTSEENAAHNLLVRLEKMTMAARCKLDFKIFIDDNEVGEFKGGLQCSLLFGNGPEISVPRYDALKIKVNTEIDYEIDVRAYITSLEQQVLALSKKPELTKKIESAMVGMLGWAESAGVAQDLDPTEQLLELSQKDNPFLVIESLNTTLASTVAQAAQAQEMTAAPAPALQAAPSTGPPGAPPIASPSLLPGIFQTGSTPLPPPAPETNDSLYRQMLAEGGQAMSGVGIGNGEIRIRDMKDYLAGLKVTKEEAKSVCLDLYQNAGENDIWKAAISLVSRTCEDAPSWTADTLYIAINAARNSTKSIAFSAMVEQFAHTVFRVRGDVCKATFQAG